MAAIHLGHSMPDTSDEDVTQPKKLTSKKLEKSSFYHVSAGSGHMAVVSSGYNELNGN